MRNGNDIIRQYLALKHFNRVSPINGYEVYELNDMKVSIDFHTGEYIFTRPDKEPQQGKYENAFEFIIETDKYRLL